MKKKAKTATNQATAMNSTSTKKQTADSGEEYVNMPLKPEVKSVLQNRAAENGRNMGREAAAIITKVVMRGKTKPTAAKKD